MERNAENYIVNTEDGCQYQMAFVHPEFGRMIIQINDPEGEKYKDLDELENDIPILLKAIHILCMDEASGDTVIVPENIVKNSVLVIHEIK